MQILIAGDAHCDRKYISYLYETAKRLEVDKIFQLGDFGYWPKEFNGRRFLAHVSRCATKSGIPFYWLDGNHEDHKQLQHLTRNDFIEHEPNLYYSPRGHKWEWDGFKFMSMGGSYSIPTKWRIKDKTWFEDEELINEDDVQAAIDAGRVDVLLSHDAPIRADIRTQYYIKGGVWLQKIRECDQQAEQLERICQAVRPRFVYHGHHHMNYMVNDSPSHCRIRGLADNNDPSNSWTIFDTERKVLG